MPRKLIILSLLLVLLVIGGGFAYYRKSSQVPTIKAEIGSVKEEVAVVGKVTSASNVDLSFEMSGRIAKNAVTVGQKVKEGDTLITLDQSELQARLNSAKANLQKSLVEYNSLKRSSASSYSTALNDLRESLHNAYGQADDAIRNRSDQFYTNPRANNATFDPTFTDGGYTYLSNIPASVKSDLSDQRIAMEKLLTAWESEVENIGTSKEDLDTAYLYSRNNLLTAQNFLDNIASAINSITTENYTYRATINGYKATISSARDQLNNALSSISAAKSAYSNGPTLEEGNYDNVLAAESSIQSLREEIKAMEADIRKATLTAPITGTVTRSEGKRGEAVVQGAPQVSIISEHEKQVEAQVSELNIGRISVGNTVEITFDALPDETYEGKVIYIDPAETIIDEIPTYKVTVAFNNDLPEKVRSGFTANLNILTASRDNVVNIPSYTLTRDTEGYKVKVKGKKGSEMRKVEIGLRGINGTVEIVQGIDAGQEILVK
jgi:HlyD family secretion protein